MLRHLAACIVAAILLAGAHTPLLALDCPTAPPAMRDLTVPRFYGDKAGTVVDAELAAAHKAAVKDLTGYVRQVTQASDKAVLRTKPSARDEAARCALAWLSAWAEGGALLGRMETKQAEYQRKWDLAGLALAYLKVRQRATSEQQRLIAPWLRSLADRSRAFFDTPNHKRNNHWYWLGLGLAATALATESPRHWDEARRIFDDALGDISADGSLPRELERQGLALHYHDFAVTPLVVMAEIAQSRGEDWYARRDGALHRLVAFGVAGFANPENVARLAGAPQRRSKPGAVWSQLYSRRFPERLPAPLPGASDGHRWLGGKAAALASVLASGR